MDLRRKWNASFNQCISLLLHYPWRFCRNASVNVWHLESAESFQRRTEKAKAEVEYGLAAGNFDLIVINNDLDKACMDFDAAIKTLYNGDCHWRFYWKRLAVSTWRTSQLQYIHCGLHASKKPVPVLVHNVGGWHLP